MADEFPIDILLRAKDEMSGVFDKVTKGLALFTAGAAVVGGAVVGAISATNDWANKLDSIGDQLGTTADQSAGLIVAIQGVGGDSERIGKQLVFMQRGLIDAKGELGPTGKELAGLGINMQAFTKLDAAGQFEEVAKKLAQLPDGLQKTELETRIFGGSAREMSDTLNAVADGGISKYIDKAKKMGLAIGDDGVNKSIEFNKAMSNVSMSLQGVAVTAGNALLPIVVPLIEKFSQAATTVLPQVGAALTGLVGTFSGVGDAVGGLASDVLPFLIGLKNNVVGIFDGSNNFAEMFRDWFDAEKIGGVIDTVIAGVRGFIGQVQEHLPEIEATVKGAIGAVVGFVQDNWPKIEKIIAAVIANVQAFIDNPLKPYLAFLIEMFGKVVAWVQENWPLISKTVGTVLNAISNVVQVVLPIVRDVFTTVFGVLRPIVEGALTLVLGVIKTVMQLINGDTSGALQTLWDTFSRIFAGIFGGVKGKLDEMGRMMAAAWVDFQGKVEIAFNRIKDAVINPVKAAIDWFGTIGTTLSNIGNNIVSGIISGITNAPQSILRTLDGIVQGAITAIKRSLGMASPSKVFANIGENMMVGLAQGISGNASIPRFALSNSIAGVMGGASNQYNNTANVNVVVNGGNAQGVQSGISAGLYQAGFAVTP